MDIHNSLGHFLRQAQDKLFATHLLEARYEIRTVQTARCIRSLPSRHSLQVSKMNKAVKNVSSFFAIPVNPRWDNDTQAVRSWSEQAGISLIFRAVG